MQAINNQEITSERGSELLGVSTGNVYKRSRKLREKILEKKFPVPVLPKSSPTKVRPSPRSAKVHPSPRERQYKTVPSQVFKPTPGGPLTEERIDELGIVTYEDYVGKGLSTTDFWNEYFTKVVRQVSNIIVIRERAGNTSTICISLKFQNIPKLNVMIGISFCLSLAISKSKSGATLPFIQNGWRVIQKLFCLS